MPTIGGDPRGQFFQAMTGRDGADVSGSRGSDITAMLLGAFGASRRHPDRPDTAAAAKALKVTQRTVQRWLATSDHQHQRPRAATLSTLVTRARQAATTKAGRARTAQQSTRGAIGHVTKGMRVVVSGRQGVSPDYFRQRSANFDIDPDLAPGFVQAWVDGGDAGASRWLVDHCESTYQVGSWAFGTIDQVRIEPEFGGRW